MKKIKKNHKLMNSPTIKYGAVIVILLLVLGAGIWTFRANQNRKTNADYAQTLSNLKFITVSGQAVATKGDVEGTVEITGAKDTVLAELEPSVLNPWSTNYTIANVAVPKGKKNTIGIRLLSEACGASGTANVEVGVDQTEVTVSQILDSSWCIGETETE